MKKKIVLFDIDGTLLKGESKVHLEAFDYAFQHVWKLHASINEIDHAGKTDRKCIFEVLEKHNIERSKIETNLIRTYRAMTYYFKKNSVLKGTYVVNPGINELLSKLANDRHVLGIVSGNLAEIGKLKLKISGIIEFFNVYGFGGISEDRPSLVKEAVRQAEEKFNQKFSKNDIFVIGDTPFDIMTGKVNKTKTIVVVAYRYTADELKKYGPDYILEDFKNYNAVADIIES